MAHGCVINQDKFLSHTGQDPADIYSGIFIIILQDINWYIMKLPLRCPLYRIAPMYRF